MRPIASKLTTSGTFVTVSVSANSSADKGGNAAANAATGRRRTTKRNFMHILNQIVRPSARQPAAVAEAAKARWTERSLITIHTDAQKFDTILTYEKER